MKNGFLGRTALMAVAVATVCGVAQAQDSWPSKPITMVVPFPPGWAGPPIPSLPTNVNWPRSS